MITLLEHYQAAVAREEIHDDLEQRRILIHLQRVLCELDQTNKSWFRRKSGKSIQGIYLYGPVGRGKTYLLDLLFQAVPTPAKLRLHFHHFMQQIDAKLRKLQGRKDPLHAIATELAREIRVLCLDEFLVQDITHAMILANLLQALFSRGVILVTTSNIPPDELYLHGLQRARFLPAIELLKQHCEIISFGEDRDYRGGRLQALQTYLYPLSEETHRLFTEEFRIIAGKTLSGKTELSIQNRFIACVQQSKSAIWFRFSELCNVPRSQLDYLEIAEAYPTLFLSDVPVLTQQNWPQALLFAHLIDVLYDKKVKLFLTAPVPLANLYQDEVLQRSFARTQSRLQEMQSVDYLDQI